MGILYPNEAIACRWEGALQARLRRAPLEAFLRARSIVPASTGISQDSDNLTRATVLIVEMGLSRYFTTQADPPGACQQAMIGHLACLVSRALADLILQPAAWRTAALVATAQLLSPRIGLNEAALASASSTRQFQRDFGQQGSPLDMRIGQSAAAAVDQDSSARLAIITGLIATRFHAAHCSDSVCTRELLELQAGS